jgi:protein SCO1/2
MKRGLFLFVGLIVSLALLGTACGSTKSGDEANTSYRGAVEYQPKPKPDFTLTDTSGAPFDLLKETEGYLTLLYFGYTNCPDVCPVHMANIAAVLDKLPVDVVRQIKVVFVTIDPERDTPERLREWLDRFDTSFIGLTGTEEQLQAAQAAAGVPPAVKQPLDNGGYGMSHAGYVIAYTKDDVDHIVYPFGVRQSDWAHDLPKLVNEGWTEG